ncbi:helix-turn-helix domain-containing protein [Streptomyces sp. NPDC086554]|uniref:helix-turn-helix domain-containing protein n=1 Tax=Streptomyces sp. NPDC086554 TaxID=3154864 RepID=UPI00341E916D
MPRWKYLPASLGPRHRAFVTELRRLKDRSGLSIAALSTRTGFSSTSWDRYLNGRVPPPAAAVEALAGICGAEPARLLALRDLAVDEPESGPESGAEPGLEPGLDPGQGQGPSRDDRPKWSERAVSWPVALACSAAAALLTAAATLAGLFLLAPWEKAGAQAAATDTTDKPYTGPAHPRLGEFVFEAGKEYACEVERDDSDGKLYAGYSRTHTEMIEKDASRWSVVETQCLLTHHGISPGTADGAFGNNTERAVKRLQAKARIALDGKVGPDTWKVLRKLSASWADGDPA